MASIAIDFGAARIKVAAYDAALGKATRIDIGRERRAFLPHAIYISADGELLAGHDAQIEADRDPAGSVHGTKIKHGLDKPGAVLRNGHKFTRLELAETLFRFVREESQRFPYVNQVVTNCWLTVPATFDTEERLCILESARRAGFAQVTEIEEPVAAGTFQSA